MTDFSPQTDYDYREMKSTILKWLKQRLDEDSLKWLIKTGEELANHPEDWRLYTSFSAVPRYTGKELVIFSEDELNEAESIRKNWKPINWTADQLGRVLLLLAYAGNGEDEFLEKIDNIFMTSDLGESVTLYKGLPLYPYPKKFKERAAEGVRSNITTVFNAVAHHNPYPAEYLDEGAWNQIVLKALFVESALYKIIGLDERTNETLAKMLVEYAHERWSAGREVSPELWRPVWPFLKDDYLGDIKKVLNHDSKLQKKAAILALKNSDLSNKDDLLKDHSELISEISKENLTWTDIGEKIEAKK